jgi:type IV pilus assembly protein PilE
MAGFTLVELLTVIVIVAILVSVAVPSYNAQTRKSRRTEARTALLDIAGREERFFSTHNAYTDTPSELGYGTDDEFPVTVGSGYYEVSVEKTDASADDPATFTLTASPVAGKGQDKDGQCNSFTVTQTGKQTAEDKSGTDTTATCWG